MPRRRNHRPDLSGLLVVDKRLGMSSAAVCGVIRGKSRGARVGHAGALDPLATGVLLVCLGDATKTIPGLMASEKRYLADVDLSAFSSTDDLEGEHLPVPGARAPSRERLDDALASFLGWTMQAPPAHSAVQIEGARAYDLARSGRLATADMPRKPVFVREIAVVWYDWPLLRLDVACGKGFYVRSLARDLGERLGTGGRLFGLRRTAVGPYTDAASLALEDVPEPLQPGDLRPSPDADALST